MQLLRPFLYAGGLTALLGCSSEPAAPAGVLLGKWGGQAAEINASVATVDMRIGCGLYRGRGPIVPDAAGMFVLVLGPRASGLSITVEVVGTVSSGTITFDATTQTPAGTNTARFAVRKGAAPDYTFLSCLPFGG